MEMKLPGHKLTSRRDYAAGATIVYCTCGWRKETPKGEFPAEMFQEHLQDIKRGLKIHAVAEIAAATHGVPVSDRIEYDELAAKRFDQTDGARGLNPLTALEACKAWIAKLPEEDRPSHIIVFTGKTQENGASGTRFFQAGEYGAHAQFGMVMSGLFMLHES